MDLQLSRAQAQFKSRKVLEPSRLEGDFHMGLLYMAGGFHRGGLNIEGGFHMGRLYVEDGFHTGWLYMEGQLHMGMLYMESGFHSEQVGLVLQCSANSSLFANNSRIVRK